MSTLQSPGVSVTVIDDTITAGGGTSTVPLIIIATGSNKLTPDGTTIAPGTIPANAGILQLITSQRDLLNTFGAPNFEIHDGTVVQGSEISEYGLHAAYSYLGIANTAYILRASVDLSQLAYRQDAPTGAPVNGTYWFDLVSTAFGIFRANGNATPGLAWDNVVPLLPAASDLTSNVPSTSYGVNGNIAIVTTNTNNVVYEKIAGAWLIIGSPAWDAARPTVATGTVANPTVTNAMTITINGSTVAFTGGNVSSAVTDINTAAIPNITASSVSNHLVLTLSTGLTITISGNTGTLAALGLTASYVGYKLTYATHVNIPVGTHSGDFWIKTTTPNFGANYVIKRYDVTTGQFAVVTAPFYVDDATANTAYGIAKVIGSLYVQYDTLTSAQHPVASQNIKRWDGTNWTQLVYTASATAPASDPATGTYWISDSFRVDIMSNTGSAWDGYLNAFPATDPAGVQITSEQPTTQSGGAPLVDHDLWLNSDDVDNYPALYRFSTSSSTWTLIDKTDQTTPFGIVFADARGNADGSATGSEANADMLVSNYVDAGTPNPETYPAGMLLFNTRYSTYNVKQWEPNFYAGQGSYTVGSFTHAAPTYLARWVTASGNQLDGSPYMGRFAQRQVVIDSIAASVVANDSIRSEFVFYNLLAAPSYPEVISDLIELNVDRKETAFIITDVPFRLKPDGTSLSNWANNTANRPSTDEFGRTNLYTYSAEYYPHGLSTDLSGNEVLVPASTIALRTYAYNDSVSYPWFSPAGTQRGIINNASSVGYLTSEGEFQAVILNQGQRDVLYENEINPIAFLPGRGLVVYGDKTLEPGSDTALSRVNVARLVCYLRYNLENLAQPFLFQLNTDSTRAAAKSLFDKYLADLIAVGAITDFITQCDSSNNTPTTIDNNELHINVAIVPTKSINFIYIPITLVQTGGISRN